MKDEPSPIIIADGTIHIRQPTNGAHFRIHGPDHAAIRLAYFQPYVLGFLCNATADGKCNGNTVSPCATGNNAQACALNINPSDLANFPQTTKWALSLCDTPACVPPTGTQATLIWSNQNDLESIHVMHTAFSVEYIDPADHTKGAELKNSGKSLKSASLTVTLPSGTAGPYNFTCPAGSAGSPATCLTIAYDCYVSGNAVCGK